MVVVAQLVRASDCGSESRRFESGLPPAKARLNQTGFFDFPALLRFFILFWHTFGTYLAYN